VEAVDVVEQQGGDDDGDQGDEHNVHHITRS